MFFNCAFGYLHTPKAANTVPWPCHRISLSMFYGCVTDDIDARGGADSARFHKRRPFLGLTRLWFVRCFVFTRDRACRAVEPAPPSPPLPPSPQDLSAGVLLQLRFQRPLDYTAYSISHKAPRGRNVGTQSCSVSCAAICILSFLRSAPNEV